MKTSFLAFISILFLLSCTSKTETTSEQSTSTNVPIEQLKLLNLLQDSLEMAEGIEVIVSYVEVPKHMALPVHYHPGVEYAYILEGSGEVFLEGDNKMIVKAGYAGKIPLKRVHGFTALDEGAKMVVFRVHETGQPHRILVEDPDEH
ncbi:cupin domain-containing protein [Marinoscillum sp. MHG1-6]|uniref:cupin domain-containing protein n=1 Tax=Marinoscillum sp. MHG1-6 TaxID=2959627 RepID=UPI002157EA4A|nr:cupin domain-containing protein [Marinoscillum sp. MHG1-6]